MIVAGCFMFWAGFELVFGLAFGLATLAGLIYVGLGLSKIGKLFLKILLKSWERDPNLKYYS